MYYINYQKSGSCTFEKDESGNALKLVMILAAYPDAPVVMGNEEGNVVLRVDGSTIEGEPEYIEKYKKMPALNTTHEDKAMYDRIHSYALRKSGEIRDSIT